MSAWRLGKCSVETSPLESGCEHWKWGGVFGFHRTSTLTWIRTSALQTSLHACRRLTCSAACVRIGSAVKTVWGRAWEEREAGGGAALAAAALLCETFNRCATWRKWLAKSKQMSALHPSVVSWLNSARPHAVTHTHTSTNPPSKLALFTHTHTHTHTRAVSPPPLLLIQPGRKTAAVVDGAHGVWLPVTMTAVWGKQKGDWCQNN